MPTTRPRHIITETDEVARALAAAARRWPQDSGSRGKLLVHLVEEGFHALEERDAGRRRAHAQAIRGTSGTATGLYGPDYLQELREDWPE
ncbi:hypothetical protein ACPPVT_00140 [Angustibacter sp. McL0619]|uniref:hypothetical protein n=1 Tax=Angustibacter sp. McL0619 TaxID=3415676 RepID=UPI003CEA0C37